MANEFVARRGLISIGNITGSGDLGIGGNGVIDGNLTVGGTLIAQEFKAELVSSSIIYESGSTKFGDTLDDIHQRTGSFFITGSDVEITSSLGLFGSSYHTGGSTHIGDHYQVGDTDHIGKVYISQNLSLGTENTSSRFTFDSGDFGSPTFVSGFAGAGFKLQSGSTEEVGGSGATSGWKLELDHLSVRGTMRIYELLINQIRATNGSLWVSSVGKVETVVPLGGSDYALIFDTGSASGSTANIGHGFFPNDLIRAQRFIWGGTAGSGTGSRAEVYRSDLTVVTVSGSLITASLRAGATPPSGGFEYVRIGNTSNPNRRGAVYLTADDSNAPFIDVIDNVNSFEAFESTDKNKVRMGKLNGITSPTFGVLSGSAPGDDLYGFWASGSAYLEGSINATAGKIADLIITSSKIYTGDGDYSNINTPFFLSSSGQLSLKDKFIWDGTDLFIAGAITASAGEIGGFYIGSEDLWAGNATIGDTGTLVVINSSDPKIALGPSADSITVSGTQAGVVFSGSGDFKAYGDADNYIRKLGTSLDIKAGTFDLDASTVVLNSANGGTFALGATVPTSHTNGTGIFLSGSGQALIGNSSGPRIQFTGTDLILSSSNATLKGNSVEISGSNFHLLNGNITASNVILSGNITATTGNIGGFAITADALTGSGFYISGGAASNGFFISSSGFNVKGSGNITASAGLIAGWTIDSAKLQKGSYNQDNTGTAISLAITSSGTSYAYNGSYIPDGLTLSWHRPSNAGTLIFGQMLTNADTPKTDYYGIQMMDNEGNEYFALGADVNQSGGRTVYNRIAGWSFDQEKFTGGAATLSSTGNLTLGTNNDVIRLSADDGTYRLWAGNTDPSSAPFSVTKAGVLNATGAVISGNITATTGSFTGNVYVGNNVSIGPNATAITPTATNTQSFSGDISASLVSGTSDYEINVSSHQLNLITASAGDLIRTDLIFTPNSSIVTNTVRGDIILKIKQGATTREDTLPFTYNPLKTGSLSLYYTSQNSTIPSLEVSASFLTKGTVVTGDYGIGSYILSSSNLDPSLALRNTGLYVNYGEGEFNIIDLAFSGTGGGGTSGGGTGTVTSITAGTNLTGGIITSTGTIALDTNVSGLTSLSSTNISATNITASGNTKFGDGASDSHSFTGSLGISGSVTIKTSGSTLLDIQGSQGQLFSVTDSLTGTLMSVNDISGLPILEVSDDDKVVMGTFGAEGLVVTGSNVIIGKNTSNTHKVTGSLNVSGALSVVGNASVGNPIDITPDAFGSGQLQILGQGYTGYISLDGSSMYIGNNSAIRNLAFQTDETTRVFISSSGNVGIGTTTPEALLHLSKTQEAGEGAFIYVDNPAASTLGNKAGIRFSTNTGATFANYGSAIEAINTNAGNGAEALTFFTWNGAARDERVRISAAGNVGIGTTTPSSSLEVFSKAPNENRTLPHNVLTLTAQSDNNPYDLFGASILFKNTSYVSGLVESARIRSVIYDNGNLSGSGLWFETTPTAGAALTSSLVLDYRGSVGIGTTTPVLKLDVVGTITDTETVGGSAVEQVTLFRPSNGTGGIRTGFNTTSGDAYLWSAHSGGSLNFGTRSAPNNNVGISLLSTGNVGIGTTAPDSLLVLSGSSPFLRIANTGGDDHGIKISYGNSNTHGLHLLYNGNSAVSYIDNTYPTASGQVYGDIHFRQNINGSMTSRMMIQARTGNVGIGTTSPIDKLHVVGNLFVSDRIYNGSNSNSAGLYFPNAATRIDGYNGITFHASEATVGSQTERMRITNTGNVGIGTTAPSYQLAISNGGAAGIEFGALNGNYGEIYSYNRSTSAYIPLRLNGSTLLLNSDSNGEVGIGTTSPTQLLHIRKDQAAYTWARIDNQSADAGAYSGLQLAAYGNTWGLTIGSIAANANSLNFVIDAGGTDLSRMTIEANGKVGIGTTTPNARLEVNGDMYFSSNDGTVLLFGTNPATNPYLQSNTTNDLSIGTGGGSKLYISSSGNVGIGTTSPSAPLMFGKSVYGGPDSENFYRIKLQDQGGIHNDVGIGQPTLDSLGFNVTANGGYIAFYEGTNGERMRINGANVGIGTSNPSALLSLNDANNNQTHQLAFSYQDTLTHTVGRNAGTGNLEFKTLVNNHGFLFDHTAAGTRRFNITNMDVGIGTTTPGYKLDINGGQVRITETASDSDGILRLKGSSTTRGGGIIGLNSSDAAGHLYFYNGNNLSMVISSSGNVGIGTTTPSASLHVNGDAIVGQAKYGTQISSSIQPSTVATVATIATGSYHGAYFDYTIAIGDTGRRVGTAMATWLPNTTTVQFTDYSTLDIGSTSDVTIDVDISEGSVRLRANNQSIYPIEVRAITRVI